jgi:hypothetical protein
MRDTLKSPPTFPAESPLASNWQNGRGRFLIDGFPRKMDQAIKFDESVSIILSFPYRIIANLISGLRFCICPVHLYD